MLSEVSIRDAERWDAIVKTFETWDVYYLSGYSRAFQVHGDGEPILLLYEDKGVRAMNVVMKRDIQKDRSLCGCLPAGSWFDLATPYGYGGFVFEGEATIDGLRRFDDEYCTFCRSKGIVSEFVRFHPLLNNSRTLAGIYDVSVLGKTISMDLLLNEGMWRHLTSENRNMIRKGRKGGVEILWGRSAELYEVFRALYAATMNRCDAIDYYYFGDEFFTSILNDLKFNSILFYATLEGKILAMSVILFANGNLHYHLSASDQEYRRLAPNNVLLYEVACWGCENGYRTFHLGGGLGSSEDSLYKFKSAFNRDSHNTFSVGRKIFDQDKYDELVEIRKAKGGIGTTSSFFPKYRATIGK